MREELGRLTQGLSMLESVDQLAQEGHADPRLYTMLIGALRALADQALEPALVPAAFFLKALALEGASPVLEGCASCGRPDTEVELVAFDFVEGGALCPSCRRGRPMSEDALILMRRILGGELGPALKEQAPAGAIEVVLHRDRGDGGTSRPAPADGPHGPGALTGWASAPTSTSCPGAMATDGCSNGCSVTRR